MERLSRAWQRVLEHKDPCAGAPSTAINGKRSHTDRLFSPAAAAPIAAFTPALPQRLPGTRRRRRRRRAAREKHWHAARKKLNREIKIKFKCHAGSSSRLHRAGATLGTGPAD